MADGAPPSNSQPWSIECPVRAADGRLLGSLRLLHGQARDVTDEDSRALQDLAGLAATAIEQRHALSSERADEDTWREEARKLSLAIAGSGTGVWDRNVVTGEITYSPGWKALLGYSESELSTRIEDAYARNQDSRRVSKRPTTACIRTTWTTCAPPCRTISTARPTATKSSTASVARTAATSGSVAAAK
ncbi:hypothetical protein D3C72_1567200 [compost metagenome]